MSEEVRRVVWIVVVMMVLMIRPLMCVLYPTSWFSNRVMGGLASFGSFLDVTSRSKTVGSAFGSDGSVGMWG